MKKLRGGVILEKIIKKLSLFIFLILISTLFNHQAYADIEEKEITITPIEGVLSTNPNVAMGSINPIDMLANSYLVNGKSYIEKSGRILVVSGNTTSKVTADKVAVHLYVQYWNDKNRQWVDLMSGGVYSRSNASYVSGSKTLSVPPGFKYRIRAYHMVKKNGKVEQANSYSNILEVK